MFQVALLSTKAGLLRLQLVPRLLQGLDRFLDVQQFRALVGELLLAPRQTRRSLVSFGLCAMRLALQVGHIRTNRGIFLVDFTQPTINGIETTLGGVLVTQVEPRRPFTRSFRVYRQIAVFRDRLTSKRNDSALQTQIPDVPKGQLPSIRHGVANNCARKDELKGS